MTTAAALRRDVAFMRTEWLLFTMHFKRIAVPLLATAAIIYLPIMIAMSRVFRVPTKDANVALDVFAIMLFVFFSLPVGTAAFSRQFKEQNVLFLHTLPMSRTRQWLVLIAASLAALLCCALMLAIIRPSALTLMKPGEGLVFAGFSLFTFAAGACFALAFLRPIEVYVGAYALTIVLQLGAFWSALAPATIYYTPRLPLQMTPANAIESVAESTFPMTVVPVTAFLFLALFLGSSLYFYRRGELSLTRNRIRNPIIVVAIGLIIDFVVIPTMIYGLESRRPFKPFALETSDDGRYVAYMVLREGTPWDARLRIVDTNSGRTTATINSPGLTSVFFAGHSIAVVARDMSLHRRLPFLASRDRLDLYSVDGKLLHRATTKGETVVSSRKTTPDAIMLALRSPENGRVAVWDSSGNVRELAHAEGISDLTLGSQIAYAHRDVSKARVWRVGESAVELPWVGSATHENPSVVHGVAYATPEIAARSIDARMPVPRKPGDVVVYEVPTNPYFAVDQLFAEVADPATRRVSLFSEKDGRWQQVTSDLQLSPLKKLPESPATNIDIDDLQIARANGLVAFVVRRGTQATVRLYDAARAKTFDVMTLDDSQGDLRFFMHPFAPSPVIVYVERVVPSNPTERTRVAEFVYRDGKLSTLPHHVGFVRAVLPDGTQIRQLGFQVTIHPAQGTPKTTRF